MELSLEQLKDLHEQVKWARHNGGRVTVEVEVLNALLPELPKEEAPAPATAGEPAATATPEPAATPAVAPVHSEGTSAPSSEHAPSQAAEQK